VSEPDLDRLFNAHAPVLSSLLLRKSGDPHLAADLTQESFLRLAERRGDKPIDNIPGWLHRTAHNLLIDHYRRERRHKTDSVGCNVLDEFVEPGAGPEEQLLDARQRQHLRLAITELSPRTQAVLRLNRLAGLTHAEVAQRLNICTSSVQKHLTKALAQLRERLQEQA
jgi:RNA polymerase sigma-70 factor (ECF subfamily)